MNKRLVIAIGFAAACFVLPAAATSGALVMSAPTLSLKPAVGPPRTQTTVKGVGYRVGESVALFFDGGRVGAALADSLGQFTTGVTVPAAALPGQHVLQAVGLASGLASRTPFLVRTDWLQGCLEAGRSCFNPYENVLGRGTVARLALGWRASVATDGRSAPVYANGKLFVGTAHGLVGLDPRAGRSSSTSARGRSRRRLP